MCVASLLCTAHGPCGNESYRPELAHAGDHRDMKVSFKQSGFGGWSRSRTQGASAYRSAYLKGKQVRRRVIGIIFFTYKTVGLVPASPGLERQSTIRCAYASDPREWKGGLNKWTRSEKELRPVIAWMLLESRQQSRDMTKLHLHAYMCAAVQVCKCIWHKESQMPCD